MSEFQKDSLSLEETNKVRISLGLKPLEPDSDDEGGNKGKGPDGDDNDDYDDPLKNQEEKAAKNYEQYQGNMRREREEREVRERIAKAQNKRELSRKLRGPTLGEAETSQKGAATSEQGPEDTLRWIKAQKKKAKLNAAKRLKEEAEAEELAIANAARYDTEDLKGLRVGHDMDEIDLEAGGEGRVLTLRDSKILEGEDDELMDSALEAAEKDKVNAERKKGVKKYSGLDDDDFRADQVGRKKGVLSKYDNDIESSGIKQDDGGFVLGGSSQSRTEREEGKRRETEQMLNRTLLDLDYTKNVEVSDYLQEGDVGFKKPKTKKKKRAPARVRLEEDEEAPSLPQSAPIDEEMAEASTSVNVVAPRRQTQQKEAFIDDDDLALSLAKSRREKAKKSYKKMTPEMIARNLAAQREAEEAERLLDNGDAIAMNGNAEEEHLGNIKEEISGEGGLVFDDTSEFVRNVGAARQTSPDSAMRLQRRADAAAAAAESIRRRREEQRSHSTAIKEEGVESPSISFAQTGVDADTLLDRSTQVKEEEDEASDEEMEEGGTNGVKGDEDADDESTAPEPLVSGGMAGALSLLRQQGLLSEVTVEQKERERKQKEYDAWLATRRFEDRVREAELAASKAQGSAKDQATREYENRMRELEDAKRAQEKFKNYTPDIEIKYTDEFGRTLNYHEAWKRLSHVFHGKLPGQKKQEQRIQRIMDEKKREKMLAGDTPSGMTKAFSERAERSGQAHMVLGVGSKNNAPQEIGLLGPNTVSRPKEKGKGKERDAGVKVQQTNGFNSVMSGTATATNMTGTESSLTGITSMIPRSTTTRSKAGFAPVRNSSSTHAVAIASAESPLPMTGAAPPSKFKMAFSKRPAPDSSSQTPPIKQIKMEE
ncbi:hypothetical protein CBS101457_002283 [Exobasidium rhododendri]|nr:hypothetical protein CBS101457_002283 [Exobasidium rhododendri]